jgi:hypothetical protein
VSNVERLFVGLGALYLTDAFFSSLWYMLGVR